MAATDPRTALLLLADGRFPVGGHANSAGAEWASEFDDLGDPTVLGAWLRARLDGPGVTDAAFAVAAASRVGRTEARAALADLDVELIARMPGPRARTVGRQLGRQFLTTARRVWPDPRHELHHPDGPLPPIALGATAGILGLTPADIARVSLHHLAANAITAAVRLVGVDPIAGAALQAELGEPIEALVAEADRWGGLEPADLPGHTPPLAEMLTEHHGGRSPRMFVA